MHTVTDDYTYSRLYSRFLFREPVTDVSKRPCVSGRTVDTSMSVACPYYEYACHQVRIYCCWWFWYSYNQYYASTV